MFFLTPNQMYFIFPPHLTCASAIPGETGNPKIASFHLNAACFLPKNSLKYNLVTDVPPSTVKTINCMHQTGPRIQLSMTHMLCVNQDCVCRSVKRWELFFVKPEWKSTNSINGIPYYLNKCRRYQTQHRGQFFFQEDSALVHCACNTVQLLQCSRLIQHLSENVIFLFPRFAR